MKVFYEPRGKAREYEPWALEIYNRCGPVRVSDAECREILDKARGYGG